MHMKKLLLIGMLAVAAPAGAEEQPEGKSLMQQGAELFLKGLTEQMEPALDDLKAFTEEMGPQMMEFFTQMGPALGELLDKVEDWSVYEAPEMLPNGDIIIRRKPDAPVEKTDDGIVDL